jgi:Domain of unknown function (DUF4249)
MRYFFIVVAVFFLASCEKNIDFKLKEAEPLLVVDAQIEDGQPPVVVLTKSLGFFNNINPQQLANSFVRNAEVYVSNGTLTHRLFEFAIPVSPGFVVYAYSNNVLSPNGSFVGEIGKSYTLRIITEGKEYTSTTNIPTNALHLDSIWAKPLFSNTDTLKRDLFFRATDPTGLGNAGRYFTKRNSGNFLAGENSVFDDQIIDGTSFNSQIPQGIDRNTNVPRSENFFAKGDTITLKWCNVPRSTYTFWNTWEFAAQSIGNPFAQPNKVIGNISNGALGAFCGYAVEYKTVIAK